MEFRRILVHRVSTPIFSQTRAPLESSRLRQRDKSSLSLLGSFSQADTRELTDRTVAIKLPEKIRTLHATTVPMVSLWCPCAGRERRAVIKKHERDARKGDEAQVSSTTPAWCTRGRSPALRQGREIAVKKEMETERERERERDDGSGENAASVRRGQYLREGLGSASWVQPRNVIAPAGVPWFIGLLPILTQEECVVYGHPRPRPGPSRSHKMAEKNIAERTHILRNVVITQSWNLLKNLKETLTRMKKLQHLLKILDYTSYIYNAIYIWSYKFGITKSIKKYREINEPYFPRRSNKSHNKRKH